MDKMIETALQYQREHRNRKQNGGTCTKRQSRRYFLKDQLSGPSDSQKLFTALKLAFNMLKRNTFGFRSEKAYNRKA